MDRSIAQLKQYISNSYTGQFKKKAKTTFTVKPLSLKRIMKLRATNTRGIAIIYLEK